MTSFLRFLSKRAKSSSETNRLTKHQKLNGCEDLKEALENLNNRNNQFHNSNKANNVLKTTNNLNGDNECTLIQAATHSGNVKRKSRFFSFKSLEKFRSKATSEIVNSKDTIECAVIFLDGTDARFFLDKKSNADKLYEKVYYHLDLIETDYFGLQFTDTHNVQHWLDPAKCIRKQCKIGPPYTFFFKVKFYTSEPNNLKEEITRYFYFLQLKSDIRNGKVPCTPAITIELSALVLQEELGDYDSKQHSIETVSEFRFVPDSEQTEDLEESILKQYKTKCVGLTPAEAELMYLNKAKWLEMYGVDMHQVFGRDQNEYKLGLTPSGILVFEGEAKIGLFYWPKIEKITFSKKKFTIVVTEDDDRGLKQEHTFIFHLIDEKACKHLWKCAVEYHAFFRLRSAPKQANSGLSGFIRRGSRFRGPQRTEFQTTNLSVSTRRSVQFERRPSQRFSRRASYAIKRKLQEQQRGREHHHNHQQVVPTGLSTIVSTNDLNEAPCVKVKEQPLIEIDVKPQSSGATAAVPVTISPPPSSLTIKEEIENAQARLKQIEIEGDNTVPNGERPTTSILSKQPPPVPVRQRVNIPTVSIDPTPPPLPPLPARQHGNCCKLQQSSGGVEHDTKCNLLKAQQISKKTEAAPCTSSLASSTHSIANECASLLVNDHKKSGCSSCETCDKETKKKTVSPHDDESDDKTSDQQPLFDKNEQHDDKVKLIDKEMISSSVTTQGKPTVVKQPDTEVPPPTSTVPSHLKESSFIGPTSLSTITTTTTTTTTTCTTTSSSDQPQVVITRTHSIYNNDCNASAAFLHINQGSSRSTSFTNSAARRTMGGTSGAPHLQPSYKPITTEL